MSVYHTTKRERALAGWEQTVLDANDRKLLGDAEAAAVIKYVWQQLGLTHPPVYRRLNKDDAGYVEGAWAVWTGTSVTAMAPCNTVTLLHELAHGLTEAGLDQLELRRLREREMHGNIFLANYVHLLDKFMGPKFNKPYLMHTLAQIGVHPGWAPQFAPGV